MKQSLIRWNRSDYARLRGAIQSFNKQVKKLESLEDKTEYLPELKEYSELKERIVSRRELNRVINSLKRFKNDKLQERVSYDSGEQITRWEKRELNLARRRATRSLEMEKFSIEVGRKSIGMGDKRIREIEATINSFKKLESKRGSDFKRIRDRIMIEGASDRELYKAKVFRENFYNALNNLKNLDNYDVLMKELNKIKNPLSFYDKIKNSDILMDVFKWYRGEDNELLIYGGFVSSQEAFNSALETDLGLDIKE